MNQQQWDPALYDQKHAFVTAYGQDLLALLNPLAGELILDLGCGTGHLTAQIAQTGARVIGLDNAPQMIATARAQYPHIEFTLADASDYALPHQFDAVFSNAALHWVTRAEAAVVCLARVLKPGGRFVAEFGGKGNVQRITDAVTQTLRELAQRAVNHPWYFPSVGEYATLLEKHGLEVQQAWLFDRPTKLEDADGMRNWLAMFAEGMFRGLAEELKQDVLREVEARLRPTNFRAGAWHADYRRLRVLALKG
jgi:trans-aconitate 2-methyltransferase